MWALRQVPVYSVVYVLGLETVQGVGLVGCAVVVVVHKDAGVVLSRGDEDPDIVPLSARLERHWSCHSPGPSQGSALYTALLREEG